MVHEIGQDGNNFLCLQTFHKFMGEWTELCYGILYLEMLILIVFTYQYLTMQILSAIWYSIFLRDLDLLLYTGCNCQQTQSHSNLRIHLKGLVVGCKSQSRSSSKYWSQEEFTWQLPMSYYICTFSSFLLPQASPECIPKQPSLLLWEKHYIFLPRS